MRGEVGGGVDALRTSPVLTSALENICSSSPLLPPSLPSPPPRAMHQSDMYGELGAARSATDRQTDSSQAK